MGSAGSPGFQILQAFPLFATGSFMGSGSTTAFATQAYVDSVATRLTSMENVAGSSALVAQFKTVQTNALCCGYSSQTATPWIEYATSPNTFGLHTSVDISKCGFTAPPLIVTTSMGGISSHWTVAGSTSVYPEGNNAFHVRKTQRSHHTPKDGEEALEID
jgi:hypothetical protein